MIKTDDIRQKFTAYFQKKGHQIAEPSSLIPENDPSVLLTTAGMQQFKPYFLNPELAPANKLTTIQPCFRTSDVDEVGDETHLTFFEMLGNFSFNNYFKKEAIEMAIQFLITEMKIPFEELKFVVFEGNQEVAFDQESYDLLIKFGVKAAAIGKAGRDDNFWGPTGEAGPCGPTVDIYLGEVEIWSLVFVEYFQDRSKTIKPIKSKGVDTGLGLERIAAYLQKKEDIYGLDEFLPLMNKIDQIANDKNLRYSRIIADHVRGMVFLAADGVVPSNLDRGYVLRKLIRRSVRFGKLLKMDSEFLIDLVKMVQQQFGGLYPKVKNPQILTVICAEEKKFHQTISTGIKLFEKNKSKFKKVVPADFVFQLYDTYGFPMELSAEIAAEEGLAIDQAGFEKLMQEQKDRCKQVEGERRKRLSGCQSGIAQNHTAVHLLHQALREVLGSHVEQKGQDLNAERLRFDFLHPRPMTTEEIKKVEDLVNKKIKDNLSIKMELTTVEDAKKRGARALFMSKYGEKVKLYCIGDFSKELCAGPHVGNTSELGRFKIIKEQSSSAGVRRIKAILE